MIYTAVTQALRQLCILLKHTYHIRHRSSSNQQTIKRRCLRSTSSLCSFFWWKPSEIFIDIIIYSLDAVYDFIKCTRHFSVYVHLSIIQIFEYIHANIHRVNAQKNKIRFIEQFVLLSGDKRIFNCFYFYFTIMGSSNLPHGFNLFHPNVTFIKHLWRDVVIFYNIKIANTNIFESHLYKCKYYPRSCRSTSHNMYRWFS